jgi:very-short-patch-repair endonuclease
MARFRRPPTFAEVLAVAASHHGVVTHAELLALGLDSDAIAHRVARGRLHRIKRGVYAVGHPRLPRLGEWSAAVLALGSEAHLFANTAASHWGIQSEGSRLIHVGVPRGGGRKRRTGIVVHRTRFLGEPFVTAHRGVQVTTPLKTLVDLAAKQSPNAVEKAVVEADVLGLIDPETLRTALDELEPMPGKARLARNLDRHTCTVTNFELEAHFRTIVRCRTRLEQPVGQVRDLPGRPDFFWPRLGLVVWTDGLTYHRTVAKQVSDVEAEQRVSELGLHPLRFARFQVVRRPSRVAEVLTHVAAELETRATRPVDAKLELEAE